MSTCQVQYTGSWPVVNCRPDSGKEVGADLAGTALNNPAFGRKLLEAAFANPVPDFRRDIARGLAGGLPLVLLTKLAESKDGHALLKRALAELKGDHDDDAWAANQIGTALKTAELKGDPGFQKLDPTSQQTIVEHLVYSAVVDPAAVDNLIALAKSAGFAVASPDTRKALLSAQADHPGDTVFANGLLNLADDAAFKNLSATAQLHAIDYYKSVPDTRGYRGRDDNADRRSMLDNAKQVVVAPGFERSPPFAKLAAMGALAAHPTDAAFTHRLVALIDDPGFAALNGSDKTLLVDAYGGDADFAKGLDTVMAGGNYGALSGADRAKVLADMVKLHGTKSYDDLSGAKQQTLVEILGNVAAQSAAEPGNRPLRNTLDKIVDGKVKIELYERAPLKDGFYNFGHSTADGVGLNIDAKTRAQAGPRADIDFLVHEINHHLNGTTEKGTLDQFLNEYRAGVVGVAAEQGGKVTPADQDKVLHNLVDGKNPDYTHIAHLYRNLPWFNAMVKDMFATFNGKTPATIDPETVRQNILKIYSDSEYLKKAGNLDNH